MSYISTGMVAAGAGVLRNAYCDHTRKPGCIPNPSTATREERLARAGFTEQSRAERLAAAAPQMEQRRQLARESAVKDPRIPNDNIEGGATSEGGGSTKYLLIGGALLAGFFLYRKMKK